MQRTGSIRIAAHRGIQFGKWLARVRDLLEQNDHSALDFVDDFKEIFLGGGIVFTPKGELKTYPTGVLPSICL